MAEPTEFLDWTVGNPDFGTITVEPSAGKKQAGWFPDERPPRETWNWTIWITDQWIKYFKTQVDLFANQSIIYDAFVGAGGTHVDINALMADPGIANLKNILVVEAIAVDDPQVIDQDGMTFDFKADAGFTKNGPTGSILGLQITGDRVRINNGRFVGFNLGGEIAIEITGSNNLIQGCMFNDNTVEIDNSAGTNTVLNANIVEV